MNVISHISDETLRISIMAAANSLISENIIERIYNKDHTIWSPDPNEISNRLGWLDSPEEMASNLKLITAFVDEIIDIGFRHVVLLGMGGSSLAPEVFKNTFGTKQGFLELSILDTTDPTAIKHLENGLNLKETIFIAASKSGDTVETLSLLKYFYSVIRKKLDDKNPGDHFIAITDPGSFLEETANILNFRKVFINNPDIGGRYSALSFFGLVPAALIGVDITKLLRSARKMKNDLIENHISSNHALRLATFLGESHNAGRNKLVLDISPELSSFGAWIEQLIAESTGKSGMGLLPLIDKNIDYSNSLPEDHILVSLDYPNGNSDQTAPYKQFPNIPDLQIEIENEYDLGGQFFLWELATSITGYLIKVQPFDQPNVEKAKIIAREIITRQKENNSLPAISTSPFKFKELSNFLSNIKNNDYISIQAYIPSDSQTDKILDNFRSSLAKKYTVAVTVGYGPRYLHSTGQLHKGDSGTGNFIQIITTPNIDLGIPDNFETREHGLSFAELKLSQAIGDADALKAMGRKVITFHISEKDLKELENWTREI